MPDFFLVGAPKAGTTSVYHYLEQHPEIFVPKFKEPNYYVEVGPLPRNVINICERVEYDKLYQAKLSSQISGDFSVSYLHSRSAAEKIKIDFPEAKIVIIIRDPVKRAFSHWLMDFREGFTKDSFLEAFEKDVNLEGKRGFCFNSMYYDCSLYSEAIGNYKALFDNVLVIDFERFFQHPENSMNSICDFLNISQFNFRKLNASNSARIVKNKTLSWVYQNQQVRMIAKKLVPHSMKQKFRDLIMKRSEEKLSKGDYSKLFHYFENDFKKAKAECTQD